MLSLTRMTAPPAGVSGVTVGASGVVLLLPPLSKHATRDAASRLEKMTLRIMTGSLLLVLSLLESELDASDDGYAGLVGEDLDAVLRPGDALVEQVRARQLAASVVRKRR